MIGVPRIVQRLNYDSARLAFQWLLSFQRFQSYQLLLHKGSLTESPVSSTGIVNPWLVLRSGRRPRGTSGCRFRK